MPLSVALFDFDAVKAQFALLGRGLRNQRRVIYALMLRETRTRYSDSPLGFGWALIEPMIELVSLWILYALVRGRTPPVDAPLPVFLLTGIFPFYFWRESTTLGAQAERSNLPLLIFPQVTVFDCIVARVTLEGATTLIVYHLFMIVLMEFYAVPLSMFYDEPLQILLAWVTLYYAAISSAILSSGLTRLFPSWPTIFGYFSRVLFLTSGVFFTLGSLQSGVRQFASYNPLAHMLEWMRSAALSTFESDLYSVEFIWVCFTVVLFAGLALDRISVAIGHVPTRGRS